MDDVMGDWKKNDTALIWRAAHLDGCRSLSTRLPRSRLNQGKCVIYIRFSLSTMFLQLTSKR